MGRPDLTSWLDEGLLNGAICAGASLFSAQPTIVRVEKSQSIITQAVGDDQNPQRNASVSKNSMPLKAGQDFRSKAAPVCACVFRRT